MLAHLCWMAWKLPIGRAELLADLGVIDAHVENLLRPAAHLGAQRDLGAIDEAVEERPALADALPSTASLPTLTLSKRTSQSFRVWSIVFSNVTDTPGVLARRTRNSVIPFSPPLPVVRAGTSSGRRLCASVHEELHSGQRKIRAVLRRRQRDAAGVPAPALLHLRQRRLRLAGGDARQILVLLCLAILRNEFASPPRIDRGEERTRR